MQSLADEPRSSRLAVLRRRASRARARARPRGSHGQSIAHDDVDAACRAWVRALGDAGILRYCVPAAYGGARETLDSRALCVARETLAYHDGLADFAFAMQGLGSGPITLAGSDAQRAHWLPAVARGEAIAAFALSEPDAGSDAPRWRRARRATATAGVLDGCKTWISNGGIADFYCVFARTGDARRRSRHLGLRRAGGHDRTCRSPSASR